MYGNINAKPFIKWAGGKKWLIKSLVNINLTNYSSYHEPFFGGGAVFFHLMPKMAFLSDVNSELINTYLQVKHNVFELISALSRFKNQEKEYYKIRSTIFKSNIERAARFIYLNKCCFNGLYRVNKNNIFNVPYGFNNSSIFNAVDLINASQSLKNAKIRMLDFEKTIDNIKENDLVFIDPPYVTSHQNNGFVAYNQKVFSWDDQKRLKRFIGSIKDINAYFVMTNAKHISIQSIYKGIGHYKTLSRNSTIGGTNASRGKINELIFTNIKQL
ncbi:MAG: Dam family site-specific DNA-(adenine-N6)-methyltransferase [Candidatus Kapaibacterium sp.]